MAKAVKIPCPHCKRSLEVKRAGEYRCPACHQPVSVPGSAFDDASISAVDDSVGHRAATVRERDSLGPAAPQPLPDGRGSEDSNDRGLEAQSASANFHGLLPDRRAIVAIAVAVVLLIGTGVWWLNSGDSTGSPTGNSVADNSGSKPSQRPKPKSSPGTSSSDNPEPTQPDEKTDGASEPLVAAPKRKPRGIPLFDADGGSGASKTNPVETSSVRPTTTKGAPSKMVATSSKAGVAPWAKMEWAVFVSPGDTPRLNGVSVWTPAAANSSSWPLVVPHGQAVWQANDGAEPRIQVVSHSFAEHYQRELGAMQLGGRWHFEKLCEATRPSWGAFRDPILPHFWGNFYWQEEQPEAAIRFWKLAVRVQPNFAPAHANLAFASAGRGDTKNAKNELAIAARLNPLDAFGLDAHLNLLREQLEWWEAVETQPRWADTDYAAETTSVSGEARQVVNVLRTISQYATHAADRSRALNNAGVYLAEQRQHEAAVAMFQEALTMVADQPAVEQDRELLKTVFGNLERSAKEARLAEHALYGWLREEASR